MSTVDSPVTTEAPVKTIAAQMAVADSASDAALPLSQSKSKLVSR